MVRSAPSFAEVAQPLFDRLDGAVFVAHNARFDYGFLRAEFGRTGLAFNAKTLCTVRLSRYLYPDRSPHTLDALIDRFGLDGEQRHRALGDARVLWRLMQKLADRHAPSEIELAVHALLRRPALPPHLPLDAIDALPHAPGVYLFYGLNEHLHRQERRLARACRRPLQLRISRTARAATVAGDHRLEWEETAGELGALLRESELIKTRLPAHNVAARRQLNRVLLGFDAGGRATLTQAAAFDLAQLGHCYGPFSSRATVRRWMIELASEHQLCLKAIGFEGRRKAAHDGAPCFNHQLRRCRGACVGAEPRDQHTARLEEVLRPWLLPAWPYAGAVAVVERNTDRFQEQWHAFDHWCWLGSVKSFDAAAELARSEPRVFEADAARLAVQALAGRSPWKLEIVALGAVVPALCRDPMFSAAHWAPVYTGATGINESPAAAAPPVAVALADNARESASAPHRLHRADLHAAV